MSTRRRRLELVSLSSAALVAFLTRWYVGSYTATELNPLVGYLVEPFGWSAYAVAKVGAVLVAIVALEVASTWEYDGNRRWSWSYFSEVGAGWVALLSVANLVHDLVSVARAGIAPNPPVNALSWFALLLVGLLVVAYARVELVATSRTIASGFSERVASGKAIPVGMAFLVVLSALSGIPLGDSISPIQNTSAGSDVLESFEDGDGHGWPTTSDTFDGSYAIVDDGSAGTSTPGWTSNSYDTITVRTKFEDYTNTYPRFYPVQGTTNPFQVRIYQGEFQLYSNNGGQANTGVTPSNNTWYQLAVGFDYSNNTATLRVFDSSGNELGNSTLTAWDNSVSEIDGAELEVLGSGTNVTYDYITSSAPSSGYSVSGTVTDSDGNALENVSVSDGSGNSTTTNSTGYYSLSLANGTYDLTADAGSGYQKSTETVTVDGAPVTQNFTVGGNLQGTVKKKQGGACQGCTVELWLMNDSNTSTDSGETVEEAQEDTVETLSRSVPRDLYQPDLDVVNAEKFTGENAGKQVLVHEYADWYDAGNPTGLPSNSYGTVGEGLESPVRELEAGKTYPFSIWDRTKEPLAEDGADDKIDPGVSTSGTIVVERVGPGNSTISEVEKETAPIVKTGTGNLFTVKTHEAAGIALPEGYYKVYPKSGGVPVYYRVGQPEEIPRTVPSTDLQDANNTTATIAQEVLDKVDAGAMKRVTVETDANGHFSYSVPSGYSTVSVSVFDGRGLTDGITEPTLSDLRNEIRRQDYNGSIYMSTSPEIVHPPDTNVQITVVELKQPTLSDLADYFDQLAWLEDLLNEEAFGRLQSLFTEPLDQETSSDLLDTRDRLASTINGNDVLREAYQELATERGLPPLSSDDLSKAELQRQIAAMQEVLLNTQPSVDGDPIPGATGNTVPEVDTSTGAGGRTVVNVNLETGEQLNESSSAPSVVCQQPDGSTRWVNQSNVSVDSGVTGDSLVVEETLENGTAGCNYILFAPTEDDDGLTSGGDDEESSGGVRDEVNVQNPAFEGTVPTLQSINLNTMRPGPDEEVVVGVDPTETSSFQSVNGATVYDADGNSLPTTVENGEVKFTTSGSGSHLVKLNVSDGSRSYHETLRVKAGNSSVDYPASVRVHNGVLGRTAIASDGVESARISTESGGSTARITAEVNQDDVPSTVHVHARDLTGIQQAVSVAVVQANDGSRVTRGTQIKLHLSRVQDGAHVRVNGNPITEEATKYGKVDQFGDSTLITTHARGGEVTVKVNNNPSLADTAWWLAQRAAQSVPFPDLTIVVLEEPSVVADVVGSGLDVGPLGELVAAQEVVA